MVYLIYGNQSIRIKAQLKAIVKKNLADADDLNYVKYDFLQTPIREIMDDVSYLPLGYDHKIVVIENCSFISKERFKDRNNEPDDYDELNQFIQSKDETIDLILLLPTSSINKKNATYSLIEANGKIIYIEDPDLKC